MTYLLQGPTVDCSPSPPLRAGEHRGGPFRLSDRYCENNGESPIWRQVARIAACERAFPAVVAARRKVATVLDSFRAGAFAEPVVDPSTRGRDVLTCR